MVRPAALAALGAGDRPGRGRIGKKGLEPRPRAARIARVIRKPQCHAAAVRELQEDLIRNRALHPGQQVGQEHQLQDILRLGVRSGPGADNLVAESAER